MDIRRQSVWLQILLNVSHYIDRQVSTIGHHSSRVAFLTTNLAHRLGCSGKEIQQLHWAAMFHDIGKVIVPQKILSKIRPLTETEWRIIRLHPIVGAGIVYTSKSKVPGIAPIVLAHQEKYDGSGYPRHLQGENIPSGARILAVADSYDAITTDRVYRKARTRPEAIEELDRLSGAHFDPLVVKTFLQFL